MNNNIICTSIQSSNSITGTIKINSALNMNGLVNINNNLFNIISGNRIGILVSNPSYTLDINGDINYTGLIYRNGNIVNVEPAYLSLWTQSGTNIYYLDYVGIGIAIPTCLLDVNGDTNINGSLTLIGNFTNSGISNLTTLIVSGNSTFNTLIANGNSNFQDATILNLIVNDTVNIDGLLTVNNNIVCNSLSCTSLIINSPSNFDSDVVIQGNLTVYGTSNFLNDLTVNTNSFIIEAQTGNTSLTGTLTVNSSATINNNFTVDGESLFRSKTIINNLLTVTGNINCNAPCFFSDISTESLLVSGIVNVNNSKFIIDPVDDIVSINYLTSSTSTTTGALIVAGGVGINGDLYVNGTINAISNNTTLLNLTVNGTSILDGPVTCNDTLTVNGSSFFNNLNLDNIIFTNSLQNSGNSFLVDSVGNTEVNNLVCNGTLNCSGYSTFSNSTITGSIYIGVQNSFESGVFYNEFKNSSNSFTVDSTGNTVVNDLTVNGGCTISGGISTNSILITGSVLLTKSFSNCFLVIDTSTSGLVITLPGSSINGLLFKIIILTPPTSFTIVSSLALFGLINNNSNYSPVSSATTITCTCNIGDTIEFNGLSLGKFYLNGTSSSSSGFLAT